MALLSRKFPTPAVDYCVPVVEYSHGSLCQIKETTNVTYKKETKLTINRKGATQYRKTATDGRRNIHFAMFPVLMRVHFELISQYGCGEAGAAWGLA